MKNLTTLALIGLFCFAGIGLTGCGGPQENSIVEAPAADQGDAALRNETDMAQYEAEMKANMQKSQGGGAPAAAPAATPAPEPAPAPAPAPETE